MKQKKIDKDQRILPLTAIAIWLQVVGILKFVNMDGGFNELTVGTISTFPQLALLENEEEEIGGHTVERVTSLARRVTHSLFVDLIGWSARSVKENV